MSDILMGIFDLCIACDLNVNFLTRKFIAIIWPVEIDRSGLACASFSIFIHNLFDTLPNYLIVGYKIIRSVHRVGSVVKCCARKRPTCWRHLHCLTWNPSLISANNSWCSLWSPSCVVMLMVEQWKFFFGQFSIRSSRLYQGLSIHCTGHAWFSIFRFFKEKKYITYSITSLCVMGCKSPWAALSKWCFLFVAFSHLINGLNSTSSNVTAAFFDLINIFGAFYIHSFRTKSQLQNSHALTTLHNFHSSVSNTLDVWLKQSDF